MYSQSYSSHVMYTNITVLIVRIGDLRSTSSVYIFFYSRVQPLPLMSKQVFENNRVNFCISTGFIVIVIDQRNDGGERYR